MISGVAWCPVSDVGARVKKLLSRKKKKMPRHPVSPKGVLLIVLLATEEILLLNYLRHVYA